MSVIASNPPATEHEIQNLIKANTLSFENLQHLMSRPTFNKAANGLPIRESIQKKLLSELQQIDRIRIGKEITAADIKNMSRAKIAAIPDPTPTLTSDPTPIEKLPQPKPTAAPISRMEALNRVAVHVGGLPPPPIVQPADKPVIMGFLTLEGAQAATEASDLPTAYVPLPHGLSCLKEKPEPEQPEIDYRFIKDNATLASPIRILLQVMRYHENTAVFIDGPNLKASLASLGIGKPDYSMLRAFFSKHCHLTKMSYYAARIYDTEGYASRHALLLWLESNGYEVVARDVMAKYDTKGNNMQKSNMDVELAVDMVTVVQEMPHVRHVILFSGDGDFTHPIKYLRTKGIRTTVISSAAKDATQATSMQFRKAPDLFIDLRDLMSEIGM